MEFKTLFREMDWLPDYLSDGIQVIDAEGKLLYTNERAVRREGLTAEFVRGKHLLDVYPSLTEDTSTLLRVLKEGEPIVDKEQTFKTYMGKEVATINTTIPIKRGKKVVAAIEISKNITEVKNLSERVMDLQSRVMKRDEVAQADDVVYCFEDIRTLDPKFKRLIEKAKKAARQEIPMLIYGETGTGKELLVQSVHAASRRSRGPFVAQNCAALPASLLEGILFGTKKGGFTGSTDRLGLFELAHGGTLFLDEINSMPLEIQGKLLRVLQDGRFRRVGDTKTRFSDVRVIAATNTEPQEAIESGLLRRDLYYRLNVVYLEIPPLRDRAVDIPLLTQVFTRRFAERFGKRLRSVEERVMDRFMLYEWPGNVRELEHVLEGIISVGEGEQITVEDLPHYFDRIEPEEGLGLKEAIDRHERKIIERALLSCRGNVSQAAEILEVPRQTLQYKIKKYHL